MRQRKFLSGFKTIMLHVRKSEGGLMSCHNATPPGSRRQPRALATCLVTSQVVTSMRSLIFLGVATCTSGFVATHGPVASIRGTLPAVNTCLRKCTIQLEANNSNDEPMQIHHAAALLAGTSIGGGFLALPTISALMGFLPAAVAMIGMWSLLMVAALAYAEGATRVLASRTSALEEDGCDPDVEDCTSRVSIASLSEAAFGHRISNLCTIALGTQILAMVTAQLVKSAESA